MSIMSTVRAYKEAVVSLLRFGLEFPGRTKSQVKFIVAWMSRFILRIILGLSTLLILCFLSFIIYGAFYYGFLPTPLYQEFFKLNFKPCTDSPGKCSEISSTHNFSEVPTLMAGQPYIVSVELEFPECLRNRELGMFISCLNILGKDGTTLRDQCTSSLLPFRSIIVRHMRTLVFLPGYALGYWKEFGNVRIDFFKNFVDEDSHNPAKAVEFIIKSRFIEIYSAKLKIFADFKGLRAWMFYYPITSALVGTLFYFGILTTVAFVSWFCYSEEEDPVMKKTMEIEDYDQEFFNNYYSSRNIETTKKRN